jgi:prophage regulatory protein
MLTWLGDDVEILIRPRLQRTKRGALRVLQAAAVERPDDFEPVRAARGERLSGAAVNRPESSAGKSVTGSASASATPRDDRQLLDKHGVEKMTSLDITTIYRRMAAGSFPQPVRVGRRRVAWRTSDIVKWQQDLEVGTETLRWRTRGTRGNPRGGGQGGGRRD